MTGDCRQFYEERDRRTRVILGDGGSPLDRRVIVLVGPETARTEPGQLILLTLANLLPRVHRRVDFVMQEGAEIPRRIPAPFSDAATIVAALRQTARTIDPCGDFRVRERIRDGEGIAVGIGENLSADVPWQVGAKGAVAWLSQDPVPVDAEFGRGTMRGAGLAACLAASVPLQTIHGAPFRPRRVSAWNYLEGDAAALGPATLEKIDPGRVLMVGAGAVGSSLGYWLQAWGTQGRWTVVDGDSVELHNTNRSLLFAPTHAGWPEGTTQMKADLVAQVLPNATSRPVWYDEAEQVHEKTFDIVLPLANERGVRSQLAARGAAVMLHATTGKGWVSQLHRHVKGRDDCLACRMVGVVRMDAKCAEGQLGASGQEGEDGDGDAALPYLSAASGLMLGTALQRLCAGDLASTEFNDWHWYFRSRADMVSSSIHPACDPCPTVPEGRVRRRLYRGRRWIEGDPAVDG